LSSFAEGGGPAFAFALLLPLLVILSEAKNPRILSLSLSLPLLLLLSLFVSALLKSSFRGEADGSAFPFDLNVIPKKHRTSPQAG
jgi:hypothetical protein